MTASVRRDVAFALVGALALTTAVAATVESEVVATVVASGPFVGVALLALWAGENTAPFEWFARPGDRQDGTLYGLAGFALASAGLGLLSVGFGLPPWVVVATVFVLTVGTVAATAMGRWTDERAVETGAFVVGGFLAGLGGAAVADLVAGGTLGTTRIAELTFLAAVGALVAGLLRVVLFERDDPLVLLSVALVLWFLSDVPIDPDPLRVGLALGVTAVLGVVSYAMDTASVAGMLTGVLLALLAMVLGDVGWFLMLVTFFGLGGLSTKYRYEAKRERGIAEPNEGARGTGNVLANSLVALVAVVAAAASPSHTGLDPALFRFAFAGAVATALGDTFSSEFGGLADGPRLITTLQPVEPGTDGAVTWQGEVAGLAGAACIAGIGLLFFDGFGPIGAVVVLAAGFAGMTADSVLGATLEGERLGNQGVNLLATAVAALAAVVLALAAGLV